MASPWPSGVLVVSIKPERSRGVAERDSKTIRRLIELAAEHQIAATWALSDPAVAMHLGAPPSFSQRHEMALQGNRDWAGNAAGRGVFAKELSRRLRSAEALGLQITSLLLDEPGCDEHAGLMAKHGLTAVCPPQPLRTVFGAAVGCRTLRHGLWEIPISAAWPTSQGRVLNVLARWRVRRGIDRAVAARTLFHLHIDLARLTAFGKWAESGLERILRFAAGRRRAGSLVIETMADAAARLSAKRQATPARSILKSAA